MKTIAERLRHVREKMGIGQAEASSKFGIPVSTYRKYETGPSEPGSEAIAGISRAGVNANWLLTGEGAMLLSGVQQFPALPVVQDDQSMMAYMAAVSTSDGKAIAAHAIDESLLSSCHAACKAVYGDKFEAESAVVQMGYAAGLYGLLVRLCASNGKDLGEMKRLEVNGLIELLKTYVRLGWSRKFPPPHDYGCFF